MPVSGLIAGETVKTTIECTIPSQQGLSVLYYKILGTAGDPVTLDDWCSGFSAQIVTQYKAWLSNAARYQGIRASIIYPFLSAEFTYFAASGVGTAGANLAPAQVSGLIKKTTGYGGPKGRGRMYVPFLATDSLQSLGHLTATGLGYLEDIATVVPLVASIDNAAVTGTVTAQMILTRPPYATGNPVIALAASTRLATQRRRGEYGRTNPTP